MSERMPKAEKRADEKVPSKRELQEPIGEYGDEKGSWISGTGDESGDPARREAAERARRAVRPGRDRE
jgi:hypothetical protein